MLTRLFDKIVEWHVKTKVEASGIMAKRVIARILIRQEIEKQILEQILEQQKSI